MRDVPLNGPWYPEEFGHLDPFVMLSAIAALTTRIKLGTAAVVLPIRHPLHIAKAAVSLDILSQGRFILGLGSGDRPEEFVAFDKTTDDVRDIFREHWDRLSAALEIPPRVLVPRDPSASISLEIRPAAQRRISLLSVGSGAQSVEWIARHSAGWATYHRPPELQRDRYALWRRAVDRTMPGAFKSFNVALRVELAADDNAPAAPIDLGYRLGARSLPAVLEQLRESGVHHVLLNLDPTAARHPTIFKTRRSTGSSAASSRDHRRLGRTEARSFRIVVAATPASPIAWLI